MSVRNKQLEYRANCGFIKTGDQFMQEQSQKKNEKHYAARAITEEERETLRSE
jgi:hypothetical protein